MLGQGLVNTFFLATTSIVAGLVVGVTLCILRLYGPKAVRLDGGLRHRLLPRDPDPRPARRRLLRAALRRDQPVVLHLGGAGAVGRPRGVHGGGLPRGHREPAEGPVRGGGRAGAPVPGGALEGDPAPGGARPRSPRRTSNSVAIAKDTSLASVVAMPDLLKQATDAQALTANPLPPHRGGHHLLRDPVGRRSASSPWLERRAREAHGR